VDFTNAVGEMVFFVGNDEDGSNLSALYVFCPAFAALRERVGLAFTSFIEFKRDHLTWWVDEAQYAALNDAVMKKLDSDDEFFSLVKRKTIELADEIYSFSRSLTKQADYSQVETSELVSLMRRQSALVSEMLSWALILTTIELPNGLYMNKFDDFVAKRVKEKRLPSQSDYSVALSTPLEESNAKREFKGILAIAAAIEANADAKHALLENKGDADRAFAELKKVSPALAERFEEHAAEFGWVYYGYSGPAWSAAEFAREAAEILSEKNAARVLAEVAERDAALGRKQREYEALFAPAGDEYGARVVRVARGLGFVKAYRKESMFYAYYAIERVQREFAARVGLTLEEVHLLAPFELDDVVRGSFDKKRLRERAEYVVLEQLADGSETRVFEGAVAREKGKAFVRQKVVESNEVHGVCAQPGHARGVVRVVNKPAEVAKMQRGDVLVSVATTPDLVTAMRKAAAIVTNLGGFTSHAAIVARELGVPCVVGTRVATKVFKDGDVVEVNATHGIVKKTG